MKILVFAIALVVNLVCSCLGHNIDRKDADGTYKEMLLRLYELEIKKISQEIDNNNINNNNNNNNKKEESETLESFSRDGTIKKRTNIGCYPLNFYSSNFNSFSMNSFIFTNNNNVFRKTIETPPQEINNFVILSPEPYWTSIQIKKFHRVVTGLKEKIKKLKNPDHVRELKKAIAKLLGIPIKRNSGDKPKASRKRKSLANCIQALQKDPITKTRHLCYQCQNDKRLSSNMFPRDHQEIVCSSTNNKCLATFGKCVQKYRYVTVLQNTGNCVDVDGTGTLIEKWDRKFIRIRSSCECQITYENNL